MKKIIFLSVLSLLFVVWGCSSSTEPEGTGSDSYVDTMFGDGTIYTSINWVGTEVVYDTTIEKNDFSLIYFHDDACGWCYKLESESFTDAEVIQIIGESFNFCKINTKSDTLVIFHDTSITGEEFTDIYNIVGTPQIIIISRNGTYLDKIYGYYDAQELALRLHAIRSNY